MTRARKAPAGSTDGSDVGRVRQLADAVDCVTEEDLLLLAGVTAGTAEAWRKRGLGPPYVILGNRVLYPREPLRKFLHSLLRDRREVPAKSLL